MSSPPEQNDTVLDALLAAGDIAYDWDLLSDRLELRGDLDKLLGPNRVGDGAGFNALVNAEDLPKRLHALAAQTGPEIRFDCEYRIRHASGAFVWVHDRGQTVTDAQDRPVRMKGLLRIVNDRKAAEESQRERAVYDILTGHYNQTRLRESLEHALSYASRYRSQGGYLVVGVTGEEGLSDAVAEDAILLAAGQRLEQCLRTADLIGRLDGQRFGVVLGQCTEDGLATTAAKIVETVTAAPVSTPKGPVALRVSVGGVIFPSAVKTVTGIMAGGDHAHLTARRMGRFSLFSPPADPAIPYSEQADIGDALQTALREDRITLAWQPVVRSADGGIAYYETLLRIAEAGDDAVPASVFIPVAERLGFCQQIDQRVLELAVAELIARRDLVLAINISGLTVTDRAWFRRLRGLLKSHRGVAGRLIIEITETADLYDFQESLRFVDAVRKFGCRVALDDFGVGHTTFRHLKTLPVDIVKIDGSFVRGVANDDASKRFIGTLLDYCRRFDMECVAEGVETRDDHDFLVGRGVTYLQGWMLGRPELDRPADGEAAPAGLAATGA